MTLLYIIACLIIFVFITIATEIEWFGWSTITLIGTVVAARFLHVFDLIPYVKTHIINSIIYSMVYIVIGIVWSFPKWFFFLRNYRDECRKALQEEKRHNSNYNRSPLSFVIHIPQASNHKGKIIAWMAYWPFSLIGTLLNDPVRKMFNIIFDQFKTLYQKMADSIFKDDVEKLNLEIKESQEKQGLTEKIINQNHI